MDKLINPEVSRFERIFVFSLIFILYLVFAFVSSVNKVEHSAIPGFISICGISIFIISLQTAFLLYNQSKIRFDSSVALLSSGYLFISFLVLGRIVFLPGTLFSTDYIHEDSQVAAWLWTIWHLIFPIYIILYSLIYARFPLSYQRSRLIFKLVPLFSILTILFLMFNDENLPKIINGNDYSSTIYIDSSLFILCLISMFFLVSQKGTNHRQDLWLLLALAVHGLDIMYGLTGGMRYSTGWYLAMVNSVIASSIILGVFIHHLIQITQSMSHEYSHLKNVSEHDELTKISNRRKFNLIFETLWTLSLHQKKPLCLILIDIDNFKSYNDKFGHLQGDECLIRIANILKQITRRETDLVARIGGEEFAILLYGMTENDGVVFAEKARQMVEDAHIPSAVEQRPFVTISVGYGAIIPHSKLNHKKFVNSVDEALYRSKHKGRNRVSVAEYVSK